MQKSPTNFKTVFKNILKFINHDHVKFIPDIQRGFNNHKLINMIHYIDKIKIKNHKIISRNAEKHLIKFNIFPGESC